jgi:predicted transcriptional regulator
MAKRAPAKRRKPKAAPRVAMTAEEFATIRSALGVTQKALADRTGIHPVTIAKYESGGYPIFKPVAELMRCLERCADLEKQMAKRDWK